MRPAVAPGTFDGVVERLDYLRDLGVNAIELMPPAEFPGDFSWGYNPSPIFAVESDVRRAAGAQAVRSGRPTPTASRCMLDVVYNHFGPTDLDLVALRRLAARTTRGASTSTTTRAVRPRGAHTRPDYGRPEVRAVTCATTP